MHRDADARRERDGRTVVVCGGHQGSGQAGRDRSGVLRIANRVQQDDELVAAEPRDLESSGGLRGRPGDLVVAPQDLAEPLRHAPEQVVADDVSEHVVHAPEVVEVHVQHRERMAVRLRGLHRLLQAVEEAGAVRQPGESVLLRQFRDAAIGARALFAECQRQLPHFVGMKRLLQVEELVGRRDSLADVGWVHVGVGGADDDLHLLVDLADPLCCPDAVGTGRHAHVEECHGERVAPRRRLREPRLRPLRRRCSKTASNG